MSKRSASNAPVAVTDAKKAKVDSTATWVAEFESELRKIFCAGAIVSRQDKEDPEKSRFAEILRRRPNIILFIWHENIKEKEWKKHFDTYEEKFIRKAGQLIEDDSRFHWEYLDSTAIVVSLSGNKRKQTKDVPKQCSYKVDLCVSSDELAVEFQLEVLSMNKESDFITNAAKREGPIEWSESVVQWKERTGFDVRFEPFAYSSRQYDSIFLFFTIEWETMKIPATPTRMRKEIVKILPKVFDDVLILAKPEFSVRWKEEISNYLLKAQLKRLTLSRESETEQTQLCEGLVTVPIDSSTSKALPAPLSNKRKQTKDPLKQCSYKVGFSVQTEEESAMFLLNVYSMNKESDFILNAAKREGPIEWSESVAQWQERTGFEIIFAEDDYILRQYDEINLFFTIEWETMKIPATGMRKEIVEILPKVFDDVLMLDDIKPEFYVRWKEEILKSVLKAQFNSNIFTPSEETEHTQLCQGLVTVPIVEVTEQEQKRLKAAEVFPLTQKALHDKIRSLTLELESTKRDLKSASSAAVVLQKELHNKRSHISDIELELANMKGQLIQAKEKIAELSRSAAKVDSDSDEEF